MSTGPSERWLRIEAILERLFEIEGTSRERELIELTAGDEDLREEIRRLLAADADRSAEFDRFLDEGAAPLAEAALGDREDTVENVLPSGGRIGLYVLERILGSGGMSIVYLARRQDGAFRQDVAVKVLRHPGRHPDLVRRFRIERQILAHLRHPNIARVIDGGVADGGWPYLVMDYVEGEPITEYCARTGASLERRLDLFDAVCAAVHHAHQRLVVHRDLKPSNILVTPEGEVKLLDFGIAKLLDAGDAGFDHTVPLTETGLRLFTPDYAAPEQLKGDPITTATDVYALGVLLYEILAGERPYRLQGRRPSEIERIVCIEDPAPPSTTAVRTGAERATDTTWVDSHARQWRSHLRGDLDTICLKALRKEPELRYASAQDLAADLQRHREGLPVKARPATAGYRFGKFVRRNLLAVGASCAVVVVSLSFATYATLQGGRTEMARAVAEVEAQKATAVTDFLLDLFRASDPSLDRGDTLSVRELLERGYERVDAMKDQPLVQAEVLAVMGRAYRGAGRYDRAEQALRRALAVHEEGGIPDRDAYVHTLGVLGSTLARLERFDEALPLQRRVIEEWTARRGERDPRTAQALGALGETHYDLGEYDTAESLYTRALAVFGELGHSRPKDVIALRGNLATVYASRGDFRRAFAMTESLLVQRKQLLGDDHLEVAVDLHNLAAYSRRLGDAPRAERLYRESLAIRRQQLPDDHPSLALSLDNLAIAIGVQGRLQEAEPLFHEALEIRRRRFGDMHRLVASSYSNLSTLMTRMGEHERSLDYSAQAVEILRRVVSSPNASLAGSLRNYGASLVEVGRLDDARRVSEESLAEYVALTGANSTYAAAVRGQLAAIALEQGDAQEAEQLRRRALVDLRAAFGERHPDVATNWHGLGEALQARGLTAEADSAFSRALDVRNGLYGEGHPDTHRSAEALRSLRTR